MKARLPKHREFTIVFAESETRADEGWLKLQDIIKDYKALGKSVYTETFIEDNEQKVKDLQKEYDFTYTVDWR